MPVERPILCYVTDSGALQGGVAALPGVLRAALRAGVNWIQIREKKMPARELVQLARAAVQEAHAATMEAGKAAAQTGGAENPPLQHRRRILVNDRLDVALAAGADGVHLGGSSLPVAEVVSWLRKRGQFVGAGVVTGSRAGIRPGGSADQPLQMLVGRSCHSLEEAQQAEHAGASYVIFGPVYATPSKAQYGAPQGIERLAEACRAVQIPVLAIGGITVENARACFEAGAEGIAAIRLFQGAPNLPAVLGKLREGK
jgi:thiamine-phosphate pyrophosphorylase